MTTAVSRSQARIAMPTPIGALARVDQIVRTVAMIMLWGGLLLVTYWWDTDGGVSDLGRPDAGVTSVGRLTGLWSANLLLVQVLLMARLPPLEHAFGRDRLARIHRVVGFLSFDLMVVHIVLIIVGYAGVEWLIVPSTTWELVTTYGGILLSLGGTICLVMVAVTSVKKARRRLRYESWHLLHLYAYLGVGLALPHQLWTGQEFLESRAATMYWWSLWIAAAGAVVMWRLCLPLWRSLRFQLRVAAVVSESADTVSILLTGRNLRRLPLHAGQFLNLRFLARPGWTRANPFSVSAAPDGTVIRITAKASGDGSSRLARIVPGTRVLFEGPYGRLSARARSLRPVVLAGAGVGVTPLRALAEELECSPGEMAVLHRYTGDPLFGAEFSRLAVERGLLLVPLPGPRTSAGSVLGPVADGFDETELLQHWLPNLSDSDVYICGPRDWASGFERLMTAAGVPRDRVHTESFGW